MTQLGKATEFPDQGLLDHDNYRVNDSSLKQDLDMRATLVSFPLDLKIYSQAS